MLQTSYTAIKHQVASLRACYLEDCGDLRFVFCDVVHELQGMTPVCVGSFADLVSQQEDVLNCEIVFLDIELGVGQPTGIDAYNWLMEKNYSGRIIFFTGHGKSHPEVLRASRCPQVEILKKPIELQTLISLLGVIDQ